MSQGHTAPAQTVRNFTHLPSPIKTKDIYPHRPSNQQGASTQVSLIWTFLSLCTIIGIVLDPPDLVLDHRQLPVTLFRGLRSHEGREDSWAEKDGSPSQSQERPTREQVGSRQKGNGNLNGPLMLG